MLKYNVFFGGTLRGIPCSSTKEKIETCKTNIGVQLRKRLKPAKQILVGWGEIIRTGDQDRYFSSGFPQLQNSILSVGRDKVVVRVMTHTDDVFFVDRKRSLQFS